MKICLIDVVANPHPHVRMVRNGKGGWASPFAPGLAAKQRRARAAFDAHVARTAIPATIEWRVVSNEDGSATTTCWGKS